MGAKKSKYKSRLKVKTHALWVEKELHGIKKFYEHTSTTRPY